jgi:hypothetical protein
MSRMMVSEMGSSRVESATAIVAIAPSSSRAEEVVGYGPEDGCG